MLRCSAVPKGHDILDMGLLLAVGTVLGIGGLLTRGIPLVAPPPSAEDTSCAAEIEGEQANLPRIEVAEAIELVGREDVTFVDARMGEEFLVGHVPGAISLPATDAVGILEVQSVPIPPENLVVTYCDGGTCERSESLALILEDRAGCETVKVLDGGYIAWVAAHGPIEGEASESSEVSEVSQP
jgi:rhodanese-related sulfurtransferase